MTRYPARIAASRALRPVRRLLQSPPVWTPGHASIASILGRELKELSLGNDQYGSGYVCRQKVYQSRLNALEEIAIALAGEEAPYFWDRTWFTPTEYDRRDIEQIVVMYFPSYTADQISDAVRPCVQSALSQLKIVLSALAGELWTRRKMSGSEAESIIQEFSPPDVGLHKCLGNVLAGLSG